MPLKESKAIGEKIRQLRDKRSMTQAQLAEHAGVSLTFLKKIESGRATLSAPFLGRIAKTLGAPADDFLTEVETDAELVRRLWSEHHLENRDPDGCFDLTTKKS